MEAIARLFFSHIQQNWNINDAGIIYPNQETDYDGENWLRLHLLNVNFQITRKNFEMGSGLFHIGVFSLKENEYEILSLCRKVKDIFQKQDLQDDKLIVRCHELQIQLLGSFKDTVLERTVHNATITIPFTFEEEK